MSKPEVDSDGFQKVKRKSKRTSKHITKQSDVQIDLKKDIDLDIPRAIKRIHEFVVELQNSNFLKEVLKSVSNILQDRKVIEFVCLGLGHVAESHTSKFQLALLLCLKEHCLTEKVLVHDPIFYRSECEFLRKLGLELITENSEGDYVISDKGPTLVYFPHCSKQLTNNFLWSNWGTNLQNCIFICNSFQSLLMSQPTRQITDTLPYIYKIIPHTTEVPLENTFKYTDIFNDTSIHTFPKENLEKVDPSLWRKGEKPSYETIEEFISSRVVQVLNI